MSNRYSLAQLKRDAREGKLQAVMTVRFGAQVSQDDLPERMRGARNIVAANSTSLFFEDSVEPGKTSMLALPRAALVEYTEDYLRIYSAGYREPNAAEQAALDAWQAIESTEAFRQRAEYDALTDGSSTYWQKVGFFRDKGMEYLMGFEKQRGLSVDINRRNCGEKAFIRDESIRGEIALEYKIERRKELVEILADAAVRSGAGDRRVSDREIEKLWEELTDVPIDEEECLDIDWRDWPKGTHREEIWHWFDEHHSKGVAWLMYEYRRWLDFVPGKD